MIENKTILRLKDNVSADLYTLLGTGRILQLTLKKEWYKMIASGEKKEEYRDMKPYWKKRLTHSFTEFLDNSGETTTWNYNNFDYIIFKNGYAKNSPIMLVECKSILLSFGNKDWGADGITKYYTFKLGKVLYSEHCA